MKLKLATLFVMLLSVLYVMADDITPTQPSSGDGSSETPYLIATPGELVWFANQVNGGSQEICGKLTHDIDLGTDQTMIGIKNSSKTLLYKGIFDGDDHTITIHYTATENYTAIFRSLGDATIKNLKTAGTISTGYQFAAGIVAYCFGDTKLNRCQSSVEITSTFETESDGTHGGLVADNEWHVTLTNCYFNGKLLGPNATNCGGLVGWSAVSAKLSRCLFNPSEVTFSTTGASTLSREQNQFDVKACYYTVPFGTEQGSVVADGEAASGALCNSLNEKTTDGTQAWYQNVDNGATIDSAPILDNTHGTVYTGEDVCTALTTSEYSNRTHQLSYDDGVETCQNDGCNAVFYEKPQRDEDNNYLLYNKGNLIWYANQVNMGKLAINAYLEADIDLGDNQTMIGTNEYNHNFKGSFYGYGHTITVHYVATEDVTGLFRYINTNAYITNLHVAGTISTGYKYAGGIVGHCNNNLSGTAVPKLFICQSSVAITSTLGTSQDAVHGGIVGQSEGKINMNDVLFNGKLLGTNANSCGGIIGSAVGETTISHCLSNPSELTISESGFNTIAGGDNLDLNLCYHSTNVGTQQGTFASEQELKSGEICYILNTNSNLWHQNLDNGDAIDNAPVLDSTHGVVYGGTSQCPLNIYSNTKKSHNVTTNDDGFTCCSNDGCTYITGTTAVTKLNTYGYGTFSYAGNMKIESGCNAYTVHFSGDKLICSKITNGIIPAYNGVLLYGEPNAEVTMSGTTVASALTDNDLFPTTTYTGLATKVDSYTLSGDSFMKFVGSAYSLKKAYLPKSAYTGSGAKSSFTIVWDDDTPTGIFFVDEAQQSLNGSSSVNKYINDGRFIIVKDGRKYSASGQQIQ